MDSNENARVSSRRPRGDATIPRENVPPVYLTRQDLARLQSLLETPFGRSHPLEAAALRAELARAVVVEPEEIPADVVTMNSRVVYACDKRGEAEVTIVYPWDRAIEHGRISVLAPVGAALLGLRVGTAIEWSLGARTYRWRVVEVPYQPEAAGDYHL